MDRFTFQGHMEDSKRTIYTPSRYAKDSLLYLQEIGSLHATYPHTNRRENLSSYLFFMVTSGEGALEYNQNTYHLSTGDCVFIDCIAPYAHSTSDNLWQLRWVHFHGKNMDNIYKKYKERGGTPTFHPTDFIRYDLMLSSMEEIIDSDSHVKDMMLYEKLAGLLVFLMEDCRPQEYPQDQSTKKYSLLQIKEYLDTHYMESITLDDLANHFFINKFYLTRIFKEQFGVTVNAYLQQVRITNAKQLLRFSDLSIDKIGAQCGLNDANYFSRVFKKVEGVSPGKFRKLW